MDELMEIFTKKNEIFELVDEIHHPTLLKYFDFESDEMLDKKLDVLRQMKKGKSLDDIDGGWDILELYPKEGRV